MDSKNIVVSVLDDIATVTVNRPEVLNSLNFETLDELEKTFLSIESNSKIKVVIITGAGEKAFVAGADIAAMRSMSPKEALKFAGKGHSCMNAIAACSKPVIAAVNGFALGGGTELVLACDIAYASESAMFGLPEVKLGIYPGFGGTQRLPRLVGLMKAKELILSGKMLTANEALEIGLVNCVVTKENLKSEVEKIAKFIASNSSVALSYAKKLINETNELPLKEGLLKEIKTFEKIFESPDRLEGMNAFLEKRKPVF